MRGPPIRSLGIALVILSALVTVIFASHSRATSRASPTAIIAIANEATIGQMSAYPGNLKISTDLLSPALFSGQAATGVERYGGVMAIITSRSMDGDTGPSGARSTNLTQVSTLMRNLAAGPSRGGTST